MPLECFFPQGPEAVKNEAVFESQRNAVAYVLEIRFNKL